MIRSLSEVHAPSQRDYQKLWLIPGTSNLSRISDAAFAEVATCGVSARTLDARMSAELGLVGKHPPNGELVREVVIGTDLQLQEMACDFMLVVVRNTIRVVAERRTEHAVANQAGDVGIEGAETQRIDAHPATCVQAPSSAFEVRRPNVGFDTVVLKPCVEHQFHEMYGAKSDFERGTQTRTGTLAIVTAAGGMAEGDSQPEADCEPERRGSGRPLTDCLILDLIRTYRRSHWLLRRELNWCDGRLSRWGRWRWRR